MVKHLIGGAASAIGKQGRSGTLIRDRLSDAGFDDVRRFGGVVTFTATQFARTRDEAERDAHIRVLDAVNVGRGQSIALNVFVGAN